MRRTRATMAVAIAGCTFAAVVASATPVGAPAAKGRGVGTAARAAALAYWTPSRMRAAVPADLARPESAADALARPAREADAAAPSFVPPAAAGVVDPPTGLRLGGPPVATASAFSPGDERIFPNRVHGRVFFTQTEGDFSCSGTVVNSPGRSLVIS